MNSSQAAPFLSPPCTSFVAPASLSSPALPAIDLPPTMPPLPLQRRASLSKLPSSFDDEYTDEFDVPMLRSSSVPPPPLILSPLQVSSNRRHTSELHRRDLSTPSTNMRDGDRDKSRRLYCRAHPYRVVSPSSLSSSFSSLCSPPCSPSQLQQQTPSTNLASLSPLNISTPRSTLASMNEIRNENLLHPTHVGDDDDPSKSLVHGANNSDENEEEGHHDIWPSTTQQSGYTPRLPLSCSKNGFNYISSATAALLVAAHTHTCASNEFKASLQPAQLSEMNHMAKLHDHIVVLDARFPYEFENGHIIGACNVTEPSQVLNILFHGREKESNCDRTCVIIHCEFSHSRGPKCYQFLRGYDRESNTIDYPRLTYPEVYLIQDGYRDFYASFSLLCNPRAYIAMRDANFKLQYYECWKKMSKQRKCAQPTRQRRSQSFQSGTSNLSVLPSPLHSPAQSSRQLMCRANNNSTAAPNAHAHHTLAKSASTATLSNAPLLSPHRAHGPFQLNLTISPPHTSSSSSPLTIDCDWSSRPPLFSQESASSSSFPSPSLNSQLYGWGGETPTNGFRGTPSPFTFDVSAMEGSSFSPVPFAARQSSSTAYPQPMPLPPANQSAAVPLQRSASLLSFSRDRSLSQSHSHLDSPMDFSHFHSSTPVSSTPTASLSSASSASSGSNQWRHEFEDTIELPSPINQSQQTITKSTSLKVRKLF